MSRAMGREFRREGSRATPLGKDLEGPRFKTHGPMSAGLAASLIYLIVPFPLGGGGNIYFPSLLSAWPQNGFPIIAYKQNLYHR